MAKADPTLQRKLVDTIIDLESHLTSSDFKSSLKILFDFFVDKLKDDKSTVHILSFSGAVLQGLSLVKLDSKLCACLFLHTFLNFLPDKARGLFPKFVHQMETHIIPALYDFFYALQNEYRENKAYREELSRKISQQNRLFLVLMTILMIMEQCSVKFGPDKGNKLGISQKFYSELQIDDLVKKQLAQLKGVTLDVLENKSDFFKKDESEINEEFNHRVNFSLKNIESIREQMKFYVSSNSSMDSETAKCFDDKMDEYKKEVYAMEELIAKKRDCISPNLLQAITKEEEFSLFLANDLGTYFANQDVSIDQVAQAISEKYEEIFDRNEKKLPERSHESIKFPDVGHHHFPHNESETSDFNSQSIRTTKINSFIGDRLANEAEVWSPEGDKEQHLTTLRSWFDNNDVKKSEQENNKTASFSKRNEIRPIFDANKINQQNANQEKFSDFKKADPKSQAPNNEYFKVNFRKESGTLQNQTVRSSIEETGLPISEYLKKISTERDPFQTIAQQFAMNKDQPKKDQGLKNTGCQNIRQVNGKKIDDNRDKIISIPSVERLESKDFTAEMGQVSNQDSLLPKRLDTITSMTSINIQQLNIPTKFSALQPMSLERNTDFNSIFQESPKIITNLPENISIRQSIVSSGNNPSQLGMPRMTSSAALDKRSSVISNEKKSNARFQFNSTHFSQNPRHRSSNTVDSKSLISDAIQKLSTAVSIRKSPQSVIKASVSMNNIPEMRNNNTDRVVRTTAIESNPPINVKNINIVTPFVAAYSSSQSQQHDSAQQIAKNPVMAIDKDKEIDKAIVNEKKSKIDTPKRKVNNELALSQKNQNISPRGTPGADSNPKINIMLASGDNLNAEPNNPMSNPSLVSSNTKLTPKVLRRNLLENVSFNDSEVNSKNNFARKSSLDAKLEKPNLQVSLSDAREEQLELQSNGFGNLSTVRNTRVHSLEGTAKHGKSKLRNDLAMIASNLQSEVQESNSANLTKNAIEELGLKSELHPAIDKNGINTRRKFEQNIMAHKNEIKKLQTKGSSDKKTPSKSTNFDHQISEQYNSLLQKIIADYESFLESNKIELREHKTYIDELNQQIEKYKHKTFNLENENISLKDQNTRLNLSLSSIQQKYQTELNKQKNIIKQSTEAKMVEFERLSQEKIQQAKNEASVKILKLTEELNNYGIENSNLKLEVELIKGNTITQYTLLSDEIKKLKESTITVKNDLDFGLSKLRDQIKKSLSIEDLKRVNELKRSRDELLGSLKAEQKKNEELAKQLTGLSNECSVLRSYVSGVPNTLRVNFDDLASSQVKIKADKLRQMIKEATWIIQVMFNNLKCSIAEVKKLRKKIWDRRVTKYETERVELQNQLTKSKFQCETFKDELALIKDRYEDSLLQIKSLQSQMLESQTMMQNSIINASNDQEVSKKLRRLQFENTSLNEMNKHMSTELIRSKEQVLRLQAEAAVSERLYSTLKNLEHENKELTESNKRLYNQLFASANADQRQPAQKQKGYSSTSDLSKFFSQRNLPQVSIPVNSQSISMPKEAKYGSVKHIPQTNGRDEKQDPVKGLAFLKKFEMMMDVLDSNQKANEGEQTLLDWMLHRPKSELRQLAHHCMQSSYFLMQVNNLKIFVEEQISFNKEKTIVVMQFIIENHAQTAKRFADFTVKCSSNYCEAVNNGPTTLELKSNSQIEHCITIVLDDKYLFQMSPIFLSFKVIDQNLISRSSVSSLKMPNQSTHLLALPLSINKLMRSYKEDLSKFGIIKSLQKVAEIDVFTQVKINDSHLFGLIHNLALISAVDRIYGVKIESFIGPFYLTIVLCPDASINLKAFAMYQSPLQLLYLQSLKFALENI